jgi:hypothetical protein
MILSIVLFCGCSSSTDAPNPKTDLEESYLTGSEEQFLAYLLNWYSESNPISYEAYTQLSDTLKAIYEIYDAFYDPLNLDQFGTFGRPPEFGSEMYHDLNYFIIQKEIYYTITPNIMGNHRKTEFYPHINFDQLALFLTEKRKNELNSFLDREMHPNDIQERYNFLNRHLRIFPGHWFGWHFLTHPEVETIYFNPDLDSASVHFRIVFEGGEANYKRIGGKWELVESYLTWIE